jgi:hypothetical protein
MMTFVRLKKAYQPLMVNFPTILALDSFAAAQKQFFDRPADSN